MPSPRSELLAGLRAELPLLLGVAPFGMIYGALAVSVGLSPAAAQAMSAIVFAGSAQFIAAQLLGYATPPLVLLLTAFVVNLRHMLYSASVAPYLRHLRPSWKWLLAYLLTDEAYAVAILHYVRDSAPRHKHWYLLGAGLALWIVWQTTTAVGIFLGARVPPGWSLEFALPLTFIALLSPILGNRSALAAALAAGVVAVVAASWSYKLGLIAAAVVGIGAGMLAEGADRTTSSARNPVKGDTTDDLRGT